jgi:hypothetical protein
VNDEAEKKIEAVYQKARTKLSEVMNSSATAEEVQAAKDAFDLARIDRRKAILTSIAGRTAYLEKLSASLAALTQSVDTNPMGNAFDTLTGVTNEVSELLKEAKKEKEKEDG